MGFQERITAAIAEGIAAGELGEDRQGMPAAWVMVTTHYDSNGEYRTTTNSNDGAMLHESLGLLNIGRAVYERDARNWLDRSVEDDEG